MEKWGKEEEGRGAGGRGRRGGGAGKWDAGVGGKAGGRVCPGGSRASPGAACTNRSLAYLHTWPALRRLHPACLAPQIERARGFSGRDVTHCYTRARRRRRYTLLLHTGTAVETSHMGTKVETSHIFDTQARPPRRHTLIHMGTAAETSHTDTHGHGGQDVTHCYTRARWPGVTHATHRHSRRDSTHCYTWTQRPRRHTMLHMGTAVETHGQINWDFFFKGSSFYYGCNNNNSAMSHGEVPSATSPRSSSKTHHKTYAKSWRNGRN